MPAAAATRATKNYLMAATESEDLDRAVTAAEAALGATAYQEAYSRGAGLAPAEAFALLVRE